MHTIIMVNFLVIIIYDTRMTIIHRYGDVFVSVTPDSYWVFQSNQYDSNLQCLQDPQCVISGKKRSSDERVLLTCAGLSTLFDGIIGREIPDRPESPDLLQHYTWQRDIILNPYVAMFFDPPLEELLNITMYFYREGSIRPPIITMCFSRSLNFTPCNTIELSERPRFGNGLVVWPVTLLTKATSVTYLRIDMEHELGGNDEWIFLSEIRVTERQQGRNISTVAWLLLISSRLLASSYH